MAANSKHYGDVIVWIEKIIESCKTSEQADSVQNLIWFFEKKYAVDDDRFYFRSVSRKLRSKLGDRRAELNINQVKKKV